MKFAKTILIFLVGATLGLACGGYLGYHIGATNRAIDTAPRAGVIAVQEERRPAPTPQPIPTTSNDTLAANQNQEVPLQQEVPPSTPEPVAPSKMEEFLITPNDDSQIMWVGYKQVAGVKMSMEGGFANFEGKITVEDSNPDKSFVEVNVDMKSVFSSNSILTTVLKSDVFFDVQKFPQARFVSTQVQPAENGYLVTGNFTLKGVTHGIQFPATIERRGENAYVKAEFVIDRKQWDVGYDSYEDSVILNEVVVSFELLAEPAK